MSAAVQAMFGRIAPRYDVMNRVLSGRSDVAWRRIAVGMLPPGRGAALDLACGTFDLGLEALRQGRCARVHGCDFCQPMLVAGAGKRTGRPLSATVGDALRLPYADGAVDLAMVAYGWRNFPDPAAALCELARVVRPGGHLLILEFFRPVRWWPRLFYGTFGRTVFPVAGALLARDAAAYRYLHDSIRGFLSQPEADAALVANGWGTRVWRPLMGGISHAVVAVRDR
jgi:ubiquinone/menaquinone biosynthesis methyltransferase